MYDGPMNWIRRTGFSALLAAMALLLGATVASAATVSEVVDDAAATGFHLDNDVTITASDATGIVSAARNNGSRFYLVVLEDTPLGGNTAFAEAVLDDLGVDSGTVLVISPDDVGWVTDNEGFTSNDLELAFEQANDQGGTDAEFAANMVVALFGSGATETTSAPATTAAASSSTSSSAGGGGSGLIWFFVIIVGIGLLLFWLVRRSKKQTVNAAAEQMAKARGAVQKQIDAIANDILDMEDEVRVANNDEVHEYYNQASETYRTLGDRLQAADRPQELLDISNDLDVAIWQLDCAEAVLDGKPKPPKPQPKRMEPTQPTSTDRVTIPAPRPDYQRRSARRSSYMGPGVMEILIGVAGQVLAGGATSRRSGGLLRTRSSSRRSSTPTARSGGGVVPGPGSPVRRSSSRRTTPRRSGGGRVRGGGKRRR
jgi:hypothetical protein